MKKVLIAVGGIIFLAVLIMVGMRIYTKQFSPRDTASYESEELKIVVDYGRPYKKGRKIFGEVVPYDQVWRTGANEATTFSTTVALIIGDEILPAGKYTLFTQPGEERWTIIFNTETEQWGVKFSGEANRDEANDILKVAVSSLKTPDVFEQFTISFNQMGEEIEMVLIWDQTLVVVPIMVAGQ